MRIASNPGIRHYSWTDDTSNLNLSGVLSRKVDKTRTLVNHKWAPFVGRRGKSMTLPAGNYEFPFELVLRGDTAETVEGLPDASITYCLQATARCGKVPYGLHAKKCLRIVRTFKPGTIALPQALSINNIWCNKVDYSITIPQKAVVFGEAINIEMQFTPLLKGLELREITARFLETRLTWVQMLSGLILKLHRTEREASMWKLEINHKEHWHDIIEHTGQAGWSFVKTLNLPKQLHMCTQDLNHDGIEVRHRIKVAATIKGPDGQISEVCNHCTCWGSQLPWEMLTSNRSFALRYQCPYSCLPTYPSTSMGMWLTNLPSDTSSKMSVCSHPLVTASICWIKGAMISMQPVSSPASYPAVATRPPLIWRQGQLPTRLRWLTALSCILVVKLLVSPFSLTQD